MKKAKRAVVQKVKKPAARRAPAVRKPGGGEWSTAQFDAVLQALNEGFYDWNVRDGTTYYSERVRAVLGLSPRQLRSAADWYKRIHPEDRAAYDAALVAHFKGRSPRFECDFRFRAGDGSWRWARQHGIATRDARGRAVRMIGSTGDITELKQREHELAEQKAILETTLENLEQGVTLVDANLRTIALNRRFLELLEFPPERFARGFHMEDAFRFNAERGEYGPGDVEEQVRSRLELTRRFEPHAFERTRPDGKVIAVRGRPLPGGAGFVTTYTDVTEQRRVERELRASQQRYELATSAALEGIYEWDLATNSLTQSDRLRQFFAMPEGPLTPAAWNERVHPEDFPRYRQATIDCFKGKTSRLEFEYRLRHPSRGWFWVLDHGVAVRDASGRAIKLVGALSDIDQRKRSEIELRRARDEATAALERQTAIAEILRVIASSPADVQPVLDAVAASAARLCDARDAIILLRQGDSFRFAAHFGSIPNLPVGGVRQLSRNTVVGRAILEGRQFHVADLQHETSEFPEGSKYAREFGYRTSLVTPLLREGRAIGAIMIRRAEARPFDDKQVELVQTFADQAVIAIANVRLFNETREALERQTATAEILKVIASSPSDVQPVFEAIARNALALCNSSFANVFRYDGALMHYAASHQVKPEQVEVVKAGYPQPPGRGRVAGRAILSKTVVCIEDALADPEYDQAVAASGGWRRMFAVPMLRDGEPVGAIAVGWSEPGPIPVALQELLKTFADQAVIAIENVRLFNETRESLERQKAAAEVLATISGSMTDAQPVFERIVRILRRLLGARFSVLQILRGDMVEMPAVDGGAEIEGLRARYPRPLDDTTIGGRAMLSKRTVQVTPVLDNPAAPSAAVQFARDFGFNSVIFTPMLFDGKVIGAISVAHAEAKPFNQREIELIQTFANQAVIAIENSRLFNETREALERQTATAEILKVIASSPADIRPVLDAVAQNAARLCEANNAVIFRMEDDLLRQVAVYGGGPTSSHPVAGLPVNRGRVTGRAVFDRRTIHVHDLAGETREFPEGSNDARKDGHRTTLATPLLREGVPVGAILIRRMEVRPFSDKQIELLQTFADQAVIAIENVRLFNETKEALERQTATAEILRVISASPTDVRPVLDAVASSAARLCEAKDVTVALKDGDQLRYMAHQGEIPTGAPVGQAKRISKDWTAGRAALEGRQIHIADILAEAGEMGEGARMGKQAGYRTVFATPLLRHGAVIGVIAMRRAEVRPFEPRQIELVNTFADQAVIAIENVRLFNETNEALERQTATSEVLRVISGSFTDTQPVFDIIAERAARLTGAAIGWVFTYDGEWIRAASWYGVNREAIEAARKRFPMRPGGGSYTARAIRDREIVNVADALAETDPEYQTKSVAAAAGYRSVLSVPMFREQQVVGAVVVNRAEAGRFSDKEVELLKTFADQAVIAIENVRLFNETKEALERQTATAEILKVISSSPTDVQPVFVAIVRKAVQLSGANRGALYSFDGEELHLAAHHNQSEDALQALERAYPMKPDRSQVSGRAILTQAVVEIADVASDPEYLPGMAAQADLGSLLGVPMLRGDGTPSGVIVIQRPETGSFEPRHVDLLRTFADQAVIAIENVRLFNETKEALDRQTATAEILKVISSSPTDVQPVFDAIVESCARLFDGLDVGLQIVRGDVFDRVAVSNRNRAPEGAGMFPMPLDRWSITGRCMVDGELLQFEDLAAVDWLREPARRHFERRGFRSALCAPMSRDGKPVGAISVFRGVSGRFKDEEVALLRTFADQAVIAIENVRLFNETKEALERQTATAEILKVISSSPTDAQPVFDAIVQSAARLFGRSARIRLIEGDGLYLRAASGSAGAGMPDAPLPITRDNLAGRVVLEKAAMQVADTQAAGAPAGNVARGYRAIAVAPLLRENHVLGGLGVTSLEPGALTEKQMELLQTFADQAVIAIENVRLFKELQQRTEALTNSVQQLTALGEVGRAISSTLDLEKVLKTIVTHALRLTGLDGGAMYEFDEATEEFHLQASENMEEVTTAIRNAPIRKGDGTVGATAITLQPIQVPDILDDSYKSSRKGLLVGAGYRAVLTVPLLREGRIIGALSVTRKAPGAFAPEVVELLKTFATQSAMAIQNARLFREIAEKGRQLEEASKHKSQFLASMSHELRTPLNAILGFNEMLLGEVYGEVPGDMKEPLTDIQSSGKHLLRLINNVLDLAKIEAGRMELALGDYSVHDTVESVRSTLRPLAEAKGLDLIVDVPADLPLAHGDSGRITQCLMNLAGNSLKFTKQGSVGISVALENGTLTWKVQDTGIGIPADKIGSLFTEFKQTDATIASEYGGTGLGLSISKKFIEMHGGRIWAESEVGQGSKFIFEVPLRAADKGAE